MSRKTSERYKAKHLKPKKRPRVPMGTVLVYLLIAAALTTGVSFSRYTTTATGGDAARVAKWDVAVTVNDASIPPETAVGMTFNASGAEGAQEVQDYTFTVNSASEVALTYSIKVSFEEKLPGHVTLWMDNDEANAKRAGLFKSNNFTFSGYHFDAGETEQTHTLHIAVDYVKDNQLLDVEFHSPATIQVIAEQKD